MATYRYEIPVIVKHFGDEEDTTLATNKRITNFVTPNLTFLVLKEYLPENSTVDTLYAWGNKDRISVELADELPYSQETDDALLKVLNDYCCFGFFNGSMTLPGRYYGYPYDEIVVYLTDEKLPVQSLTKVIELSKEITSGQE